MRFGCRLAILALAFALPSLAISQDPSQGGAPQNPPSGKTYVGLRLGAIVPQHKDLEGFDNGFAVEGTVGHRVNENIAVELSLGRFSISATSQAIISGVAATITEDVVAYPVLGTVRLIYPVDQLEVFGLVGGGIYFMSANVEATAPGYIPLTDSDSDSPFALHVGGGINVRMSPKAQLGADVKYILGTTKMWDAKSNFDSVIITGALTFRL